MKRLKQWITLGAACAATLCLGACGGLGTRTTETISSYAIYDVTSSSSGTGQLSDAIKQVLRQSMSSVNINAGIPPSPLPATPGRFQLINPFKGSALGALAGQAAVIPNCDGAVMSAMSRDSAMASYGENTMFFLCLLPYTGGYHMNIYVSFTRQSGGFSTNIMAASLMRPLTGDTSKFIPRTIQNIVKAVEDTGASVRLVEQYP